MLAIFKTGGKQHKAEAGLVLTVEKLPQAVGEEVQFDQVLLLSDGTAQKIGAPFVEGASVKAQVLEQGKARKILVFKQHQRKGYRRRYGHRQPFTRVKVTEILGGPLA